MSRILAAVDDSTAAEPVIAFAEAIAPLFGAKTDALHVADAEGATVRAVTDARGVPLRTLNGDTLVRLAIESASDDILVVVCGAGRSPAGAQRGEVGLALAGTLDKPLVIVPPDAPIIDSVQRVLMAIKGTPAKPRALKRAVELTAASGLDFRVVHVDDVDSIPSFSDQVQYETELYARQFLARYVVGAPEARLVLRIGDPADEILATADELAADVIAIGWPHTTEPMHGHVARQIIQRSRIPVLLVATT
jgi:nucleotide-binding universal stress UspA family protein